jgi:hypothetical protein
MAIRNGSHLIFPSRRKLNRCLPNHGPEVEDYMDFVIRLGCDVDVNTDNASPWLRLSQVLDLAVGMLDELAPCPQALANDPRE